MDRNSGKIATNEQKNTTANSWRSQVLKLSSKGYSQLDNARILQVNRYVICRDVIPKAESREKNIRKYIDERLSEEYGKCVVGLNAITKELWDVAHNTEDKKDTSLSTCKRMLINELDLLTNATVVDDAT